MVLKGNFAVTPAGTKKEIKLKKKKKIIIEEEGRNIDNFFSSSSTDIE